MNPDPLPDPFADYDFPGGTYLDWLVNLHWFNMASLYIKYK
jgi:hypothetical protein